MYMSLLVDYSTLNLIYRRSYHSVLNCLFTYPSYRVGIISYLPVYFQGLVYYIVNIISAQQIIWGESKRGCRVR